MTQTKTATGGATGSTDQLGTQMIDVFKAFTAPWAASTEAMLAWSKACQSVLQTRAAPAAELLRNAVGNPGAWNDAALPLIEEIRRAFALPRFADLPQWNSDLFPSANDSAEMTLLFQQCLAAMMPAWVKASQAFHAEIAERRANGEALDPFKDGLDIWNNVLDRTLMSFNRSGDFGRLQQRFLRIAMRQRQQVRQSVETLAQAVDLPTHSEMADVYARLHGLMREVHALKQEVRNLKAQSRPAANNGQVSLVAGDDRSNIKTFKAAPNAKKTPNAGSGA
jgi:hypothetical protein